MLKLQAKTREDGKSLDQIRAEGYVPAVFYGSGKESTSIVVDDKEFRKIWKEAGESMTVLLEAPSGKVDVLIHEVQMDPVKDVPIHIDFLAIDMNKEIEVPVAIEFVGESDAVKAGAVLVKVTHEVEVKALPKNLPHNLEVDISALKVVDDQILVSDIKLPTGVTMITGGEEVVVLVSTAKEEVVEEAPVVDLSAIEVEKKGKKDEEEVAPATE